MSSPYTPGVGGYVLAVVVSWLAFLAPLVVVLGPYVVVAALFVVVVGTPVGIVGAVLTHLACRDARSQGTHVVVAGLCGFALMLVLAGHLEADDARAVLLLATWVGAAAAVGRASVIRLVPARRATPEVS
jgi:hypothetical protein